MTVDVATGHIRVVRLSSHADTTLGDTVVELFWKAAKEILPTLPTIEDAGERFKLESEDFSLQGEISEAGIEYVFHAGVSWRLGSLYLRAQNPQGEETLYQILCSILEPKGDGFELVLSHTYVQAYDGLGKPFGHAFFGGEDGVEMCDFYLQDGTVRVSTLGETYHLKVLIPNERQLFEEFKAWCFSHYDFSLDFRKSYVEARKLMLDPLGRMREFLCGGKSLYDNYKSYVLSPCQEALPGRVVKHNAGANSMFMGRGEIVNHYSVEEIVGYRINTHFILAYLPYPTWFKVMLEDTDFAYYRPEGQGPKSWKKEELEQKFAELQKLVKDQNPIKLWSKGDYDELLQQGAESHGLFEFTRESQMTGGDWRRCHCVQLPVDKIEGDAKEGNWLCLVQVEGPGDGAYLGALSESRPDGLPLWHMTGGLIKSR